MANPRTCIYPSPKTFHHLRRSTFLLTALILAAILSSCGLNRAPQTDPANRQESASTCSQTDGAALAALFNATDGPNWRNNTKLAQPAAPVNLARRHNRRRRLPHPPQPQRK